MSKLNLANLAQDEMTKDEAQKVRAGLTCTCYCSCSCSCPPDERIFARKADQTNEKNYDLNWSRYNS